MISDIWRFRNFNKFDIKSGQIPITRGEASENVSRGDVLLDTGTSD